MNFHFDGPIAKSVLFGINLAVKRDIYQEGILWSSLLALCRSDHNVILVNGSGSWLPYDSQVKYLPIRRESFRR